METAAGTPATEAVAGTPADDDTAGTGVTDVYGAGTKPEPCRNSALVAEFVADNQFGSEPATEANAS